MQIVFSAQAAVSLASILCGVALFYLVMSRTLKRRAAERDDGDMAAD